MNTFAAISLFAFVLFVFLGAFVLFRDPHSRLSRLYAVLCLGMAYSAMVEFVYRIAPSAQVAHWAWHRDVLWPFNFALWVHFALVAVRKEVWLRRWWTYVLIYGPAAVLCAVEVGGHWVTGPPVHHTWGYAYSVREGVWPAVALLWMIVTSFLPMWWFAAFRRRTTDRRLRGQIAILWVGSTFVFGVNVVEYVLHATAMDWPPMVTVAFALSNGLVGYAIWRYELFSVTPERAARTILGTMGDALLLLDLEGKIVSVNEAACRMLECREQDLLGMPGRRVLASGAPVPPWLAPPDGTSPQTLHTTDLETVYRTVSGKEIPVSLSGTMLRDEDSNLRGFLLIARDITERKRAADEIARHKERLEELVQERTRQLVEANEELRKEMRERQEAEKRNRELQEKLYQSQKMEAIGRLAGGVAHDFNNLLFVINGYAESLLEDLPPGPQRDDVVEIAKAGTRAVELTGQLLAFSRKQVIKPAPIALNDHLRDFKKTLGRLVGEDIQIELDLDPSVGTIVFDTGQLTQILTNLATNARDAMPGGGVLRIGTRMEDVESPKGEAVPGPYVVLTVRDEGEGIAPENLGRIFEPFYTSKEVGKGTGLGLATVYGIVQQCGGFIDVSSTLGEGTAFSLYFPIMSDGASETESAAQSTSLAPPKKGRETVLLVEDDAQVRTLMVRHLRAAGYRVIEADNGVQGYQQFVQHVGSIDVVVTDVVMPDMNGPQMVRSIQERGWRPKVLYMSGHNEEIIDQHGAIIGDHPLLSKPFSPEQLQRELRVMLDGARRSSVPPRPAQGAAS